MSSGHVRLLESMSHSPFQEYRINDGRVESRVLDIGLKRQTAWREVSPAQLSSHVRCNTRNTNVARWLERNLGWKRLLRACVGLAPTEISKETRRQVGHELAVLNQPNLSRRTQRPHRIASQFIWHVVNYERRQIPDQHRIEPAHSSTDGAFPKERPNPL